MRGATFLLVLFLFACAPVSSNNPAAIIAGSPTIEPLFTPEAQAVFSATTSPAPTQTHTQTPAPTQTYTPSPPACLRQPGRTESASLRSPLLKLPMEVRVYLPPCYDEFTEKEYPTLYLIHGMNFTESQWENLGASQTAERLIQSGELAPFLMIMPHDRLWVEPSETPFDEVFLETLIPWVEHQYRVNPNSAYRAVGGLSRGGAWAIHFGLGHPDTFGVLGAHSAPVFWEDARQLRSWLETTPREEIPRIYLDIGEKDYLRYSNTWLADLLNEFGIPHEYYVFTGYHEEAYWESHVEDYLRWYARDW